MPIETNFPEYLLDLINTDVVREGDNLNSRIGYIHEARSIKADIETAVAQASNPKTAGLDILMTKLEKRNTFAVPFILPHCSWIKPYRNVVAHVIRSVIYLGLSILMGTTFLRLNTSQTNIQSFINAIFFGSVFMSFMAVVYLPAFLKHRATFSKGRANGLCSPLAFTISNFIIGLPYLFLTALLFFVGYAILK